MDRKGVEISLEEATKLPSIFQAPTYRLPGNQAGRRILSEGFPVKPLLVFVLVCECCLLSSSTGAARKVGEFRALTEVMNTADLCVKARCQL